MPGFGLSGLVCSGFHRKVEFIIKSVGCQSVELQHPEIFSSEEELPHLFFRQVAFGDLFDEDQPEVPVEVVVRLIEMAVDCQPIWSLYIVPMLIHTSVGTLCFDFTDILPGITFHAEGQV